MNTPIRKLFFASILSVIASQSLANGITDNIANYLMSGASNLEYCSREKSAILSTADRLRKVDFPERGKFVLVNLPGGFLTAYENGQAIFEMKIIIGKETHQTPEFSTEISAVRFNPTWTVPFSIIQEEKWKERLVNDTQFFIRNKFEFRDSENKLMSLQEAVNNPGKVARFIQAPGDLNALGRYRFNIKSSDSIYLHDTRDPENFYDGSPSTLSHGCVRLEDPKTFASWLTGWDDQKIDSYIREGSSYDYVLREQVPIILGYFTAWPSADGEIVIYDDPYSKDINQCR